MIVALAIWLIAFLAAAGYGRLLLPPNSGDEGTAYEFARVYAGLLVISMILLAAAVFTSLTPLVGIIAVLPGIAIYWRHSVPNKGHYYYCAILAIIALFVSMREINFYDTALYHQQAVKWSAEYGLVRGVALVFYPFGFVSSWSALAAPLDHGITAGRVGIMGGIPFALAVISGLELARGSFDRRPMRTTWAVFGLLLSVVALVWHVDTSLSPDMMVWLLPLVVVTIVADPNAAEADRIGRATLISAMACLIKLTAAPVFVYCTALLAWRLVRVARDRRKLAIFGALAFSALALLVGANLIASGCPVFPSSLGCTSLGWSVGADTARSLDAVMEQFVRAPPHHQIFPLTAAAALASALLAATARTGIARHVLGVSLVGIGLTLVVAPNPRYGLGCFLLPVAALAASALSRMIDVADIHMNEFGGRFRASALVAAAAAIALLIFSVAAGGGVPLLYPRRIAAGNGDPIHVVNRVLDSRGVLTLRAEKHGELTLWVPASSDQCWDAPLPCTPNLTRDDVKLRLKGNLSAGFLTQ